MLEGEKNLLRRRSLKKYASTVPTGILPLDRIRSAVVLLDVEDTSFDTCKNDIIVFFRDRGIKADIFFVDLRKLTEGERLITSITGTVLKKDLNWFGRPSKEKIAQLSEPEPDLLISLFPKNDFPGEFMAKVSRARFKIGREQLPGNTFDLVIKDPADKQYSEAELFREIVKFFSKIR